MSGRSAAAVTAWRQRTKVRLVDAHGGICVDCKVKYPPFVYDFDHRDPADKLFEVGNSGATKAYAKLLEESKKCDLVCSNCHRLRTHRQRCKLDDCPYCTPTPSGG